jgi:hypothetical protein
VAGGARTPKALERPERTEYRGCGPVTGVTAWYRGMRKATRLLYSGTCTCREGGSPPAGGAWGGQGGGQRLRARGGGGARAEGAVGEGRGPSRGCITRGCAGGQTVHTTPCGKERAQAAGCASCAGPHLAGLLVNEVAAPLLLPVYGPKGGACAHNYVLSQGLVPCGWEARARRVAPAAGSLLAGIGGRGADGPSAQPALPEKRGRGAGR